MVYFLRFWLILILPICISAQPSPSIIPYPNSFDLRTGESFTFSPTTRYVAETDSQRLALKVFLETLPVFGDDVLVSTDKVAAGEGLILENDLSLSSGHYRLQIDASRISIAAGSYAGWVYGLQTVRQLLPPGIESKRPLGGTWTVPALTVTDGPRFGWRGLMLDVARHFLPKEDVLATIDRMALLKLNVLHLHLVDDQGWRIEIKQYPKLTEVGAWRVDQEDRHWDAREKNEPGQTATYGGFYTQDDIREIVAYAADRAIRVIPEIEMPAHVSSAIAAYPEYSCLAEPIAVPSGGVWPITDIYCAGKESTFTFLENIMDEVMTLFPDRYIHVGGDEATRTNWETCPHCQRRMHEEGLHDTGELQSYFIRRMERYLSSHGKTLIGWDEILEGGLAEGAAVMSWRGTEGGLQASGMGHDVVMTPGDYVYLNQYQGDPDYEPLAFGGYVPLKKVYHFDPLTGITDADQARHILGGQANLWSEFIADSAMSEYMLYPRLAALAEVLWTKKEEKDWANFSVRLPGFFDRLDVLGANYSRSAYAVTVQSEADAGTGGMQLQLLTEIPGLDIRYTLDGGLPDRTSPLFTDPLHLDTTTVVRAATFRQGDQVGEVLTKSFDFHLAVGKPVAYRPRYSEQYPGKREIGLVNVLRGSKNFHDGQWQAWLNDDVEINIDLEEIQSVRGVSVGTMENQGSGIYFPTKVEVLTSVDDESFELAGSIVRPYAANGHSTLDDFSVSLPAVLARYVRVRVKNLGRGPRGGGAWLFLDEIVIN